MAVVDLQLGQTGEALRRDPRLVARPVLTAVYGGIFAINVAAFVWSASPFPLTHLAAAALSVYLFVETRLHLKRSDAFGLLSPVFLAALRHFTMSYLLAITVAAFNPHVLERFRYWIPNLDAALADTMLLAMLAAFCMFRGYGAALPLARRLGRAAGASPLLRRNIRPYFPLAVAIQLFYVTIVALAIRLEVYGMLSSAETREQNADILAFLQLAFTAGTLSYFLILLRYFERRAQGRASGLFGLLCLLLIVVHVGAGAISGFKSQIVFPFVTAGLAYFIATRRAPTRFIWLAGLALMVSYTVIEPYRAYLMRFEVQGSVSGAIGAFTRAIELREELSHETNVARGEQIAGRMDLAGMTTVAIDHVVRGNLQTEFRRALQDSIVLAPVLAFVPRAVWPDKPSYVQNGVWFNQRVLGRWHDNRTSVGMGPIAYLYIAGGIVGVVLGFFGFGMLQALIFEGFARGGAGGLIIYLSAAMTLMVIPTSFGPALTGLLRMLPVAFVAQLILLRRSPPEDRSQR